MLGVRFGRKAGLGTGALALALLLCSLCNTVDGFAPLPLCGSGGRRAPALRLRMQSPSDGGEGGDKWKAPVLDEAAERVESVKAGVLSAVAGSVAMTPVAVLVSSQWYPSDAFSAQWELAHDGLAVMLALFGLVYRYSVRQDPNPQVQRCAAVRCV